MGRKAPFTSLKVKHSLEDTQCREVCTLRLRELIRAVCDGSHVLHLGVSSGTHHLIAPPTPSKANHLFTVPLN